MPGRKVRKSAGKRHKFRLGRLHWSALPGGGHYPFGLRAAKAEVLLLVGRWTELEQMYRQDCDRARAAGMRGVQARLLMHHGELLGWRRHDKRARVLLEEAAAIFRELGDDRGLLQCRNGQAVTCIALGEYERAEALVTESEGSARRRGYRQILCWLLNSHAVLCRERGQIERAIAYIEERMTISQELGGLTEVASSHMNLAVMFSEDGRHDLALEQNRAALELGHRMGDAVLQNYALYNQAQIFRKMGRGVECLDCLRQALAISRHLGDEPMERDIQKDMSNVEKAMRKNKKIEDL